MIDIRFFPLVGLLVALISFSCEHSEQVKPDAISKQGVVKKVLLEVYTGVRCYNCPEATKKGLEYIRSRNYADQIIQLNIHGSDQFCMPIEPNEQDFRTLIGKQQEQIFKISSIPKAVIGRKLLNESYGISYPYWITAIEKVLNDPNYGNIDLTPSLVYNQDTRKVQLSVEVDTKNLLNHGLDVYAYLKEDSIIQSQMVDTTIQKNYVHNHVLRAELFKKGADVIKDPSQSKNRWVEVFADYNLPVNYNVNNCSIIIVVSKPNTKEVLQVTDIYFTK